MIQASRRGGDFSKSTTSGFARRELSREFFMKTVCLIVVWTVLACISTIAAFAQVLLRDPIDRKAPGLRHREIPVFFDVSTVGLNRFDAQIKGVCES